ncbi:YncE family protein [Silvibacterium sp.]|uniref:YncE family protein n=1 Tax=Silvibacterium sp. TaxID=1964179 RepID=UPI0039E6AF85
MQRFLAFLALFVFALPVGLSISGCQTQTGDYCNGLGYGPKTSQVYAIDLEPKTTGVSLSWGQTGQITAPTATTCKGASASVSSYTYGSSNLDLADISPTGAICAGTWNRNSPGGITDYTICTAPSGSSSGSCASSSCGTAEITASAAGVTSNEVPVYIHPPVSSITISNQQTACTSQNVAGPTFTAVVTDGNGNTIPSGDVGTITYTPVTSSVVTINNLSSTGTGTNGATTAELPGSTVVNASVASVSAAAGYFYTCPPTSIDLSISSTTINPSTPLNLSAAVADKNGTSLTGLTLDYTSTQPEEIAVSSAGAVSSTYASKAAISAICQPTDCNPSPIDEIGYLGNGMPVVSNTLDLTSTGQSSTLLWMASTESQYFSEVDLTNGTPSTPVKLPYIPNSMLSDATGTNLYFGSYRELMEYSASTNALAKEDTNVPGVVLAVSPDSTTLVINDQLRDVIYLYTVSSGAYTSVGGVATSATFSPDGKNVYIVGCVPSSTTTTGAGCSGDTNGALFVHNANSGWSTYSSTFTLASSQQSCTLNNNSLLVTGSYDPFCGANVAVTVPAVGPFIAGGADTTAHTFCPNSSANPVYYPAASIGTAANAVTDKLASSNDGTHMYGASASDNTFTDIGVTVPTGACPAYSGADPQSFTTTLNQATMSQISPSEINGIVSSPESTSTFVTYTGTSASGLLPYYIPATTSGQAGTLDYVQLSGTAASPVAGIYSPDGSIFFISTTGDNLIHYVSTSTFKDTQTINPGLTNSSGQAVPVQMMVVKPRSTT